MDEVGAAYAATCTTIIIPFTGDESSLKYIPLLVPIFAISKLVRENGDLGPEILAGMDEILEAYPNTPEWALDLIQKGYNFTESILANHGQEIDKLMSRLDRYVKEDDKS
jgi:hypothetical protein